jgi:hypothetical protein
MKTKAAILLAACLATGGTLSAAKAPAVESRGSFVKITAGDNYPDEPLERTPPLLLYIRKATIVSVSLTFVGHAAAYDVAIVTLNPVGDVRAGEGRVVLPDAVRAYFYRFSSEAVAASFCEAVLSNQDG